MARKARRTHSEQIAGRCIDEAKAMLGPGWGHLSSEIQWGLVAARIVGVIQTQDESTPPESVIRYFNELVDSARAEMGI